jgi:hypothetical protein
MADTPTCTWTGASGKAYRYYVYPRHPSISDDQDGNYIYVKINAQNQYMPIYIGQGDLSARATKDHHQVRCINSKGATHVLLRLNANEADRLAEEKDLLARFAQAYAPTGCNQRIGG